MSAPSPAPAAPAPIDPPARLTVLRLLGAGACAVGGVVAVWLGFGVAGFGFDVHSARAMAASLPLLLCGLVIVRPKIWLPVRVAAVLIGLGAASYAWWEVRSSNFKSAMSLREAVERREQYRTLLASAKVEDIERYEGLRGIPFITAQYPSLAAGLSADYDRWKTEMAEEIHARYGQEPPDAVQTAMTLRGATQALNKVHPTDKNRLEAASQEWLARAVKARSDELFGAREWAEFDRTAPSRKALVEAFPETHPVLVAVEETWGVRMALAPALLRSRAFAQGEPQPPMDWRAIEKSLLALKALDASDGRFKDARGAVFEFAHNDTKELVAAHLEAGRYEQAFGLARKHMVEWNATATLLGEVKKIDALREYCESFAKLHEVSARPSEPAEIAPPPRTRPE